MPVRLHRSLSDDEIAATSIKSLHEALRVLPPPAESRRLLEHLKGGSRPHWMVLHVPFAERLIDETYARLQSDNTPPIADVLCILAFLACSLFSWSGKLHADLGLSSAEAMRACSAYTKAAESLIFAGSVSITLGMKYVVTVSNLAHLYLHSRGMGNDAMRLLMHCIGLMRLMDLARLDTPARKRERDENGCDVLEIEMLRRVWLGSFGGGLSDGSYIFSPKHMNIEMPVHTNDDCVTPLGITCCQPLSVPTDMSTAILRIKLAELCREAADALPFEFGDIESVDYSVVLAIDQKFNAFRQSLPVYLSLESPMAEGGGHTKEHGQTMRIRKLGMHFVLLSRLCRLHRPYFMQSVKNPRYAFSHRACVAAAQEMLDMHVSMEQSGREFGIPGGPWTLLNHGFVAALILATDASFDDTSRQAQRRRKQVHDMCDAMERSSDDPSGAKMEGVQRNLQTLMAVIKQRKCGSHDSSLEQPASSGPSVLNSVANGMPLDEHVVGGELDSFMNSGQFLLDFVELVPEVEVQEWDSFFETTYHGLWNFGQP
ncbi:hypothetical protein PWT90_07592 [Aphanocladium album]|nr:hypothetical protein PWT90_07592 [Aphanocladium album]